MNTIGFNVRASAKVTENDVPEAPTQGLVGRFISNRPVLVYWMMLIATIVGAISGYLLLGISVNDAVESTWHYLAGITIMSVYTAIGVSTIVKSFQLTIFGA